MNYAEVLTVLPPAVESGLEFTYDYHFMIPIVTSASVDEGEYRNDRMYLWPLELDQLNKNRNIIQNTGW
jgi:hypothetical protein